MVKKLLAVLLASLMVLSLAACTKKQEETTTAAPETTKEEATTTTTTEKETETEAAETEATETEIEETEEASDESGLDVMSYADYAAADLDTEVTIVGYFQAAQSWWDNKATIYLQDEDGAYFLYEAACSEEDYAKLVPGVKLLVKGYKSEWSGEVEIVDSSFEIVDDGDTFIASATDVTNLLGSEDLVVYQNRLVAFNGVTVEDYGDGAAFAYKNAEEKTDDLYFKVNKDGKSYDFCVEYYLCNEETDVYKAVEALQVGDVIDIEAFLYWYNGPNPHVVSVKPHSEASEAGEIMSYADYMAAETDSEVTIETYFQAAQSWWQDSASIYTQDRDGGYFLYGAACSEEDYNKLVPGIKILVKGYKAEWGGEIEVADATFEIIDDGDTFVAEALDITDALGTDDIVNYQNQLVKFSDLTVEDYGDGAAFAYKDADQKTDDLYFKVSKDGETYEFCVEYYLCNEDTDVYKAVENLKVGDVIDVEGFLYWYNGINPHVTSVTVK